MLVSIVSQGEILPVGNEVRRMRAGMLADELEKRGHKVMWWTSTFSHQTKTLLFHQDTKLKVSHGLTLQLIHAGQYNGNVSLRRYLHHRRLARRFRSEVHLSEQPQVVIAAFPTIGLAYEAVTYARASNIPVIVDIRDKWPDIFLNRRPRVIRTFIKALLRDDFCKTTSLLQRADSLVATSKGYLAWGLKYAARPATVADKVFLPGYPEESGETHRASDLIRELKRTVAGKVVFTFVGTFGYSYELPLICEVAKRLATTDVPQVHFVLAGYGQQFQAISKVARCLPNLTVTGWINRFQILELLGISDVGLVPCKSATDTMPNKPFEYLSSGLPILSSLEGEMEKLISENCIGLSYPCGNADELLRHVLRLGTDEALRKRFSLNSRRLFRERFTAQEVYAGYAEHVERIAAQGRQ